VQVVDVILLQPEWAPQARGPLFFAHAEQSIATPLVYGRMSIAGYLPKNRSILVVVEPDQLKACALAKDDHFEY